MPPFLRRSFLCLRPLLPSPGCSRLHRPEVNPRPFALCSRSSNGQKGAEEGMAVKNEWKRAGQMCTNTQVRLIWTESAMTDFNSGLEPCREGGGAMIQQPFPSNSKAFLFTPTNANAVCVDVFLLIKKHGETSGARQACSRCHLSTWSILNS